MYRTTCDCAYACAPSRDGSSFTLVLLLLFGHSSLLACSRGSGAQKEQMGMHGKNVAASSMPKGHAARWCLRLGTETMGQREARLEVNVAEWRKATGHGDGRAAAVQA